MATNASHLNALFSTVLLHNILIFILSTSSLMRYQIFADFRRHCAMREADTFGLKMALDEPFCSCGAHRILRTRSVHMRTARSAPNHPYFGQGHQVPVRCPSFFSPSEFRSGSLYHIASYITLPVSPSFHIGELGSTPLISHPPLVGISSTG